MMSGHDVNSFFFKKKVEHPEHSLNSPTPLYPITSHFYLTPLPCLPQSGRHMCITPIYMYIAGIKWVAFPLKTMGKNHKNFIRNPKQIYVELHRIKWKTFGLASWKQSELDVKIKRKRKTGSSLWIATA